MMGTPKTTAMITLMTWTRHCYATSKPDGNMTDTKFEAEHEKMIPDDSAGAEFLELLFQLSITLSRQKYFVWRYDVSSAAVTYSW